MPKRLELSAADKAKNLFGKVYIVTGANSGVGLETTRQLIRQGAHVVMACRRPEAAEEVAQDFAGLAGSYEVIKMDLADLETIRQFVTTFKSRHDRLDGVDCNAGMVSMQSEPVYTKDGFELTMASSYFGHFLLVESLLDVLKQTPDSRIVILSSVVHAGSPSNRYQVHLDDMNFRNREFNNYAAYGEAKTANVLYAKELAERLRGTGVSAYSVHPGWARSNFGSGGGLGMRIAFAILSPLTRAVSDSSEQSAQTSLHCLLSDDVPQHSGAYFSQRSILYRDRECRAGGWPLETPNPNARNLDTARKLVAQTYAMVGLDAPTA